MEPGGGRVMLWAALRPEAVPVTVGFWHEAILGSAAEQSRTSPPAGPPQNGSNYRTWSGLVKAWTLHIQPQLVVFNQSRFSTGYYGDMGSISLIRTSGPSSSSLSSWGHHISVTSHVNMTSQIIGSFRLSRTRTRLDRQLVPTGLVRLPLILIFYGF